VSLEARDLTIVSRVDAMSATANVCYHINLSKLHESEQELPQALPLRARQHRIFESEEFNGDSAGRSLSPPTVDYDKDVSVYRSAASNFRVVQPDSFLDLMRLRSIRFDIVEDKLGAFGITSTSGIVFVKNPQVFFIVHPRVDCVSRRRSSWANSISPHPVTGQTAGRRTVCLA